MGCSIHGQLLARLNFSGAERRNNYGCLPLLPVSAVVDCHFLSSLTGASVNCRCRARCVNEPTKQCLHTTCSSRQQGWGAQAGSD